MTDYSRRRSSGNDDSLVPLLMGALAVATVGPAVLTAAKQWLVPRSGAMSLTIAEWWDRNWWLAAFWAVELVVLFVYLWWYNRRNRRRRAQLASSDRGEFPGGRVTPMGGRHPSPPGRDLIRSR